MRGKSKLLGVPVIWNNSCDGGSVWSNTRLLIEFNLTTSEFFGILLEGLKASKLVEHDVCTQDLTFIARNQEAPNPYQVSINYETVDYERKKKADAMKKAYGE